VQRLAVQPQQVGRDEGVALALVERLEDAHLGDQLLLPALVGAQVGIVLDVADEAPGHDQRWSLQLDRRRERALGRLQRLRGQPPFDHRLDRAERVEQRLRELFRDRHLLAPGEQRGVIRGQRGDDAHAAPFGLDERVRDVPRLP
jgi:hypothetical protein